MIFRQLFEPVSSTYTYLLGCERTRQAALIDPVVEELPKYLALLAELDLTLVYTLETHIHADHVTCAAALHDRLGSRAAISLAGGAACADVQLTDGAVLHVGDLSLAVRATPGHTDSCVSYVMADRVFTGDALLIGGCGRTDFQQGSAARLYESVHTRLFTLPPATLVFPAHDYKGRTHSTIGDEQRDNPRLGGGRTLPEFITIMANLQLAPPKQIQRAVPANLACGRE